MAQELDFANRLYYDYQNYKEAALTNRRFKHKDIVPLIERLKDNNKFTVNKVGQSAEKRDIYLIKYGTGKTKIFLWSQMHGDESTATMALFDIFNFLSANDSYNNFRNELQNNTTIYFMPMVNPDGAEYFQRRNIFDIDLNRDAVRAQSPEAKVLKDTFDSLKADFGFNLHDQSTLYSAGHGFKSAALSFLAPATDYDKDINNVRGNAMKVIGRLFDVLSSFIPGHIAKYNDDFEPRAFGDNFQRWGTSTILIESGGWKGDPQKQFLRKLNFMAMLTAFKSISENTYQTESLTSYEKIPFNERDLMDLVLRNLKTSKDGYDYKIDLGINRSEVSYNKATKFYRRGYIEDLGDLSVYFGYQDYDLNGLEVVPGKTYPKTFSSREEIKNLDFDDIYKQGYTNVVLDSGEVKSHFTSLPINIYLSKAPDYKEYISLHGRPNFVIKKDGKVIYVVINGFFRDVVHKIGKIKNGLVF